MNAQATFSRKALERRVALLLVPLAALLLPPVVAAQSWTPGPSMASDRAFFPLMALPSGDLLVAGGRPGFLTGAEVFDVTLGEWFATAPVPTGLRYRDHGVRLQTEDVLVAASGPSGGRSYLLRDGQWRTTGNFPSAEPAFRQQATLTLLADGRALLVGGYDGVPPRPTPPPNGTTYSSAELYDPVSDLWTTTGSMSTPRFGHKAILLEAGPHAGGVLVCGGGIRDGNTGLSDCEIFDPTTGSWAPTGAMSAARAFHTVSTLPDGRVLAAGGSTAAGGPTAELYDPAAETWSTVAPMSTYRSRHTATVLSGGRVLVTGGYAGAAEGQTSAEIYEPACDVWWSVANMATPRAEHAAVALGPDEVMVIGGMEAFADPSALASTEVFSVPTPADTDSDGAPDFCDNCADAPNGDQLDSDGDGLGDVCDACPFGPENDADGDGVCEAMDRCPDSDLGPVVVVDGCDTGIPNALLADGCSIADRITECAAAAGNHGAFVRCVAALGQELQTGGLITGKQKGRLMSCSGQAGLP